MFTRDARGRGASDPGRLPNPIAFGLWRKALHKKDTCTGLAFPGRRSLAEPRGRSFGRGGWPLARFLRSPPSTPTCDASAARRPSPATAGPPRPGGGPGPGRFAKKAPTRPARTCRALAPRRANTTPFTTRNTTGEHVATGRVYIRTRKRGEMAAPGVTWSPLETTRKRRSGSKQAARCH